MSARGRTRNNRDNQPGQHFLVDTSTIERFLAYADVRPGELVVDIGAGRGELTIPMLRRGARVFAVERDPRLARRLSDRVRLDGLTEQAEIVVRDIREASLPSSPYRIVANPPFNLTSFLLGRLLDDPADGPDRVDLILQSDVVHRTARTPAPTLREAAWAPWWEFSIGPTVSRRSFRPIPSVDAAVLTIHRREPALLPQWLAPDLRHLLRRGWQ